MIVECQNCGAPLDADGTQVFVSCRYCNTSNKVASSRTLAMHTPGGWQPPQQWQAGQKWEPSVVATVVGTSAAGRGIRRVATTLSLALVLAIAGAVLSLVLGSRGGSGGSGGSGALGSLPLAPSWDGQGPLRCSMNESLRIEGVTADLPRETAITAAMNCELTLVDSHITAYRGIDATGNGTIRLENSTIEAEEVGVQLSINKRLELVDSTITAGGIGVDANMNADVMVQGGRIQGSPVAVQTRMNAELDNRAGELVDAP